MGEKWQVIDDPYVGTYTGRFEVSVIVNYKCPLSRPSEANDGSHKPENHPVFPFNGNDSN